MSFTRKIYYVVFFIILVSCLCYSACTESKVELFDTSQKQFVLKPQYDSIIPLNLFTTWSTKELPPMMKKNYEELKNTNPEFNHFLYDDADCREFIEKYYEKEVLDAFDKLIPGAYKADLWRCCVLYIKGGIYIDIKLKCTNGFKFIALTEKEYFVRDRWGLGVYNALMVCKAGNPILLQLIKQIVINTQTNFYGVCHLHPTGPYLFRQFIGQDAINKFELFNSTPRKTTKNVENVTVTFGDTIIITSYDEYRDEQLAFQSVQHYSVLWKQQKIYKTDE